MPGHVTGVYIVYDRKFHSKHEIVVFCNLWMFLLSLPPNPFSPSCLITEPLSVRLIIVQAQRALVGT